MSEHKQQLYVKHDPESGNFLVKRAGDPLILAECRYEVDANLYAASEVLFEALKIARIRMLRYGENRNEIIEIDVAIASAKVQS